MSVACPDVSEFQVPLTSAYPRDFLIFRGSFGSGYQDAHFLANANKAAELYKAGRIAGAIVYTVYLPGHVKAQADYLWHLIGPTPPAWLAGVMVDVEHWGGTSYSISGDHSAEINQLAGYHAARVGWNGVIAYGNELDLAAIYPGRDRRVRCIVAGYSSRLTYTRVRGAIGQQYTDGSSRWPTPSGLPTATTPFGHCDHNVFPAYANGKALRAALRPAPGKHVTPPPPVKPGPKPVAPYYSAGRPGALVSPDRHHAAILQDDGTLVIRKDGIAIWHS